MQTPYQPTVSDNAPADGADSLHVEVPSEVPEDIEVAEDGGFRLIDTDSGDTTRPTEADDER